MRRKTKFIGLILIVAISIHLLLACEDKETSKGTEGKHLNFGVYNYSDSLDPATNTNSSWCAVRYGVAEGLFKFSDEVIPEPNIADTYEVSDDYKVWTLHIRDGVKFSNGNVVTPTAVKKSIERLYEETDASKGGKGNSTPRGYLVYESIEADDDEGTVI